MIPYLLYAALILTICLCFYQLLLQRETFYRLNRWVLLGCLLVSFLLPLLRVPEGWSFQKQQVVGIFPQATTMPMVPTPLPLPAAQQTVSTNHAAVATGQLSSSLLQHPMRLLLILYWIGAGIFAANFLLQLALLFYQRYTSPVIRDGRLLIVEVHGNKAPCSFGRWVFINPEKYDYDTYCQILEHEKTHVRGRHSVDIVLSELAVVFQWFNPFSWLFRKAVEANLEFLTDDVLLGRNRVQRDTYQISLLKVSVPHLPLRITTNYNQSLLKKRIMMMGAKKSNLHTSWKYGFLPVVLAAMASLFNEPLTHAQTVAGVQQASKVPVHLQLAAAEKEGSWFATIKKDTVYLDLKSADNHSFNNFSLPIKEFTPEPAAGVSEFTLQRQAGTMTFKGHIEGDQGMGRYQFTPDQGYKTFLEQHGVSSIGEEDMMAFFLIPVKKEFVEDLRNNGYTEISKGDLMAVAALGVDEPFIRMWKEKGFSDIALRQLITLKALHVDLSYLNEVKDAGLKNVTLEELIGLKAQGITGNEIHRLALRKASEEKSAAIQPLTLNQVITGHHLQVDSPYVEAIRALGYENASYEELWSLKSLNVQPDFIKGLQQLGYQDIPAGQLMALKSQDITPAYIKSFEQLGYNNIPLSEVLAFKTMDITPSYIESFQRAGYKDIPVSQVIGLHQAGVTPEVVDQYKQVGVSVTSLNDLVAAKYAGVTPQYIRQMSEKGFKFKDLSRYQQLKHLSENQ